MMADQRQFDALTVLEQMTDDQLFAHLAATEGGVVLGMDSDPRQAALRGRSVWNQKKAQLQKLVCQPTVLAKLEGSQWDKMQIYAVVADAAASVYAAPSLATATLLIVREGLHSFCQLPTEASATATKASFWQKMFRK